MRVPSARVPCSSGVDRRAGFGQQYSNEPPFFLPFFFVASVLAYHLIMSMKAQEPTNRQPSDETNQGEKGISQQFELLGNVNESGDATAREHSLGFVAAVKTYPKACFWTLAVSMVIIMEGYDTVLLGSLYGFPAFRHRFGTEIKPGNWQVPTKWQTALSICGSLAGIIGIFVNSMITERIGHRKALIGNLFLVIAFVFIIFFAQDIRMLFAGEFLVSIPWGVFTTAAPVYASEVGPVALRAYFETYVVLCWGFGQLVAYAVLDSLEGNMTNWAWRIPFAVQWVWPVIIIPLILWAPESPWWLVRRNRLKDAEHALSRLSSYESEEDLKNMISLMVETTAVEREITRGATYLDCFRGSNLWRTEISCVIYVAQVLVGFALTSFASYFFEQAGLSPSESYKLTLGQGGLNVVCTVLSGFVTHNFGRRTVYIAGTGSMCMIMLIIGFISLAKESPSTGAGSAAMYMLYFCVYLLTLGPTTYIVNGEVSSTRLRGHTIALGRNAYNFFNILSTGTAPVILNPGADNWKGKSGFLAGGLGFISMLWGVFRLPETKGRTYEELDIMFNICQERTVKAWQFKNIQVDREGFIRGRNKQHEVQHVEDTVDQDGM